MWCKLPLASRKPIYLVLAGQRWAGACHADRIDGQSQSGMATAQGKCNCMHEWRIRAIQLLPHAAHLCFHAQGNELQAAKPKLVTHATSNLHLITQVWYRLNWKQVGGSLPC